MKGNEEFFSPNNPPESDLNQEQRERREHLEQVAEKLCVTFNEFCDVLPRPDALDPATVNLFGTEAGKKEVEAKHGRYDFNKSKGVLEMYKPHDPDLKMLMRNEHANHPRSIGLESGNDRGGFSIRSTDNNFNSFFIYLTQVFEYMERLEGAKYVSPGAEISPEIKNRIASLR